MISMNQIFPEWLAGNERAFEDDAGRIVKVAVFQVPPEHDREFRIGRQSFMVNADGSAVTDDAGKPIRSPMISTGIDISGLATAQCSLEGCFWKKWIDMGHDATAYNFDAPVIEVGQTIDYDGHIWHAGLGPPPNALGEESHWYIDKGNGQVYRKRPGEPDHLARKAAEEMFRRCYAQIAKEQAVDLPMYERPDEEPEQA